MLKCVTLTGIDRKTNVEDVMSLQKQYPFLEFGVLVSMKRSGTEQRYPELALLMDYVDKGLNLSCHLCGRMARHIVASGDWSLFYEFLGGFTGLFKRVQINAGGVNTFADSEGVVFPEKFDWIIQIQAPDTRFYDAYKHLPNVLGFQDNSGGRGEYVNSWMPSEAKYFGYAGGITAENLENTLKTILDVNQNDFWIDMESSIRTDDWLDIEKCRRVAEICSKYI